MNSKFPSLNPFGKRQHLRGKVVAERQRLYRLAWSWCHDQSLADDLVQETMTRALTKLDSLREENRLSVWLTRIMVNLYRDHFRKAREDTGLEVELLPEEETPELSIERSVLVQRTRKAIAGLNDDHRQVITMVDIGGFSYAETAQVLDVPVGTVMSRLSRARIKLREKLEQVDASPINVVPIRRKSE